MYCEHCHETLTMVNGKWSVLVGMPDNDDCEYIDHDEWCKAKTVEV